MLIFDQFPNIENADKFAVQVRDMFGRATRICDSREQFDKYELFPFELRPPMVLVERDNCYDDRSLKLERKIEAMVDELGGRFAGT